MHADVFNYECGLAFSNSQFEWLSCCRASIFNIVLHYEYIRVFWNHHVLQQSRHTYIRFPMWVCSWLFKVLQCANVLLQRESKWRGSIMWEFLCVLRLLLCWNSFMQSTWMTIIHCVFVHAFSDGYFVQMPYCKHHICTVALRCECAHEHFGCWYV